MESITELFLKNREDNYSIETNQKKYPIVEVIKKNAKTKKYKQDFGDKVMIKEKKGTKTIRFKEKSIIKRIQKQNVKRDTQGRIFLNHWLINHRVSDGELANIVGVGRDTITDYANGNTIPCIRIQEALCSVCGINIDDWTEKFPFVPVVPPNVDTLKRETPKVIEEPEPKKENFINDRIYTVENIGVGPSCDGCDIFFIGSLKEECRDYMKTITGIDCLYGITQFKIKKKIQKCTIDNIKEGQMVTKNDDKNETQYKIILVLAVDGTYSNHMILRRKGYQDIIDRIESYHTLV